MPTAHNTTAALAPIVPQRPFPGTMYHAALHPPGARLKADAPVRNDLLLALPAEDLARLRPRLERVALKRRQVLQERNTPMRHAFFVEEGAASLLSRSGDGAFTLEVGTLGRKDVAGLPIVLGTARSPHRCVVQVPGEALRIRADDLRRAMDEMPALERLLLGYVQAAMVQSAQLVVCNARHSLGERIARWLLIAYDRLDGDEICVTHQAIGRALGVRRAGVTTAMGRMEEAGLLRRRRGCVVVVDHAGLEEMACDCHRVIRAEHQRLVCDAPGGAGANGAGACALSSHEHAPKDLAIHDPSVGRTAVAVCEATPERTDAEWRQALADKDERIQDLHHRVKNNLQIISSLLALEGRACQDPEAAGRLRDAHGRIQSLVRVHQRLYETPEARSKPVDAGAHLAALCDEVAEAAGAAERGVLVAVKARPCPVSNEQLTPLALLVSELVTNAVKHAAPHDRAVGPTRVLVSLAPEGEDRARLIVSDTGPGLPAGFDPGRPKGLGMRLVASFARQLGGVVDIARGDGSGARFAVSFPLGR